MENTSSDTKSECHHKEHPWRLALVHHTTPGSKHPTFQNEILTRIWTSALVSQHGSTSVTGPFAPPGLCSFASGNPSCSGQH